MKIALAQINPTVGDFAGNTRKILEYAARAAELGAALAVFPELAVCGYPPADFLEKKDFVARAEAAIDEIAAWTGGAGRPAILCGSVMRAASAGGQAGEECGGAAVGRRATVCAAEDAAAFLRCVR